ncbi:MAG: alpha/beta hydrolase [Burkholderiales bacterium]|nr:alpha/beta hydrolase [Burkholderiales bacterium]
MSKRLIFGFVSAILLQSSYASNVFNVSSHEIMLESGTYHYYYIKNSNKNTDPMILLTGYATTSNFWSKKFISCLSQKHDLYLLDYKGINQKISNNTSPKSSIQDMAQSVNKFAYAMNLESATLMGWSMGGAVALNASFLNLHYKHLYLLAPVVPTKSSERLLYTKPVLSKFTPDDIYDYVFNNNIYHYESMNRGKLANQFIESSLTNLFPSGEFISAQRKAIDTWIENDDVADKFEHSKIPVTFILPDDDAIINQKIASKAISKYKNKTVIHLKDVGHAIAFQDPDQVCKIIK